MIRVSKAVGLPAAAVRAIKPNASRRTAIAKTGIE
jgi:hypothetical protein